MSLVIIQVIDKKLKIVTEFKDKKLKINWNRNKLKENNDIKMGL